MSQKSGFDWRQAFGIAALFCSIAAYRADAQVAASRYTSAETSISMLLADPAAKAVVAQYLPEIVAPEVIGRLEGATFTLRDLQQFKPDVVTDQKLASIDAGLAKLLAK